MQSKTHPNLIVRTKTSQKFLIMSILQYFGVFIDFDEYLDEWEQTEVAQNIDVSFVEPIDDITLLNLVLVLGYLPDQ